MIIHRYINECGKVVRLPSANLRVHAQCQTSRTKIRLQPQSTTNPLQPEPLSHRHGSVSFDTRGGCTEPLPCCHWHYFHPPSVRQLAADREPSHFWHHRGHTKEVRKVALIVLRLCGLNGGRDMDFADFFRTRTDRPTRTMPWTPRAENRWGYCAIDRRTKRNSTPKFHHNSPAKPTLKCTWEFLKLNFTNLWQLKASFYFYQSLKC